MSTVPVASTDPRPRASGRRRFWVVVLAAAALVAVVTVIAYAAGRNSAPTHTITRTGTAHVGDDEASIVAGGWTYGVQGSVPWVDGDGSFHDGGWPSCLAPVGSTVRLSFGEVAVHAPNRTGYRAVVWVDCRGAAPAH